MTWRNAQSLDVLLDEINRRHPGRSKASDGSIGDAAHATRASDHNPWVKDGSTGVVTARDFTNDNDPGVRFDSSEFAEWLRKRCKAGTETRVKYVISDRRICSPMNDWAWRRYDGSNPHDKHVHVSVESSKSSYDSPRPWGWEAAGKPAAPAKPAPPIGATMTVFDLDDAKQIAPHKFTDSDVAAIGDPGLKGKAGSWSSLIRFPPAVARLRRELADALRVIRGDITSARADIGAVKAQSQANGGQLSNAAEALRHLTAEVADLREAVEALTAKLDAKPQA